VLLINKISLHVHHNFSFQFPTILSSKDNGDIALWFSYGTSKTLEILVSIKMHIRVSRVLFDSCEMNDGDLTEKSIPFSGSST